MARRECYTKFLKIQDVNVQLYKYTASLKDVQMYFPFLFLVFFFFEEQLKLSTEKERQVPINFKNFWNSFCVFF